MDDAPPKVYGPDGTEMAPGDVVGMPTPFRRHRVMFSDGATVDVMAHQDGSVMRGWVLEHVYGKKLPEGVAIVGVADLGVDHVYVPGIGVTDAPVIQRDDDVQKPTRKKAT